MTIGIPSYQRCGRVKTLKMLDGAFSKNDVILATQTKEEYEQYSALYGSVATIIYGEAHNCSESRNNILEYVVKKGIGEILFLDDDISNVRTMYDKHLKGDEFRKLMEECFELCRKNGIVMFGSYATSNRFMMSKTASRNIIDGMLCGLLDTSIRYDAGFMTKGDYELSLRLMTQGKKVVRFNSFAPQADARSKGGCEEIRSRGGQERMADLLVEAYPTLVKYHPTRKGEIKFIG